MPENRAPKIIEPPWKGRSGELIARDTALMARSYRRPYPLAVKSVKGCVVEDLNGNTYIDFTSGYGALPLGGRNPKVIEAVRKQAEALASYTMKAAYSELAVEVAEKLSKIAPIRGEVRALFVNSGSEAVEAALRALRWHTGKPIIIGFLGAFHGSTQGALSISTDSSARRRAAPSPNAVHVPYPYCYRCPMGLKSERCGLRCADYLEEWALERIVPPEDVAAAIFEPIEIESGVIIPPKGYYEKMLRGLRRRGVLTAADESYTAPGRTGRWLALEHWDVEVDALCFGSSLSSGLPLGVLLAREELLDLEPGQYESTSGGCQLSLAAALATLEAIKEGGLVERAERLGRVIVKRLHELAEELEVVGEVRGRGLLVGIELVEDKESRAPAPKLAQTVVEECFRVGLITRRNHQNVILTPPLNIDEEMLEKGLEILDAKLREASTSLSRASSS